MTPIDALVVGLYAVMVALVVREARGTDWDPQHLAGSALVLVAAAGVFFADDALAEPLPGWTEFVFAAALLAGFALQWRARSERPGA